jgi:hypothetical protein
MNPDQEFNCNDSSHHITEASVNNIDPDHPDFQKSWVVPKNLEKNCWHGPRLERNEARLDRMGHDRDGSQEIRNNFLAENAHISIPELLANTVIKDEENSIVSMYIL